MTTTRRESQDDGFPPLSPTTMNATRKGSGSMESGKGLVEQAVEVPLPLSPTVGEGSRY